MKFAIFDSIVYLTDDNNVLLDDVVCPVSCGKCCEDWQKIDELNALWHCTGSCPYAAKQCKLKRTRRPYICRCFTCQLCVLALTEQVSHLQVQKTIERRQQSRAFSFLGKKPNLAEIPATLLQRSEYHENQKMHWKRGQV